MAEQPTQEQCDQAKRAQDAITRELALLVHEGFEPAELIAGGCAAIYDMAARIYGPEKAAHTFAKHAALAAALSGLTN